jgi:acyl-CoA reductase-like NAD-dependent aldehyde dehydrogenase
VTEAATAARFGNFLGGEWRSSAAGETYSTRNPMRPAQAVAKFPLSGEADVRDAVAAATEAFPAWSRLAAPERSAVLGRAAEALERRLDEVALDMVREMGKPIREARAETVRSVEILRFFAGEGWRPLGERYETALPGAALYTLRRPLGAVGLITPWNFPAAIPAWKSAPALVFGNTVVLKPAEESPRTALHLAECFAEAGLPAGVLNVVVGAAEAGAALVRDERIHALSFTGSVEVGHAVRDQATAAGKRVQLELGGQNPLVVMADARLDDAVEAAFAGAFWAAGQKCTATRRIYVQDPIYDAFRKRLLARIARAAVGDPADPTTEVGPIVNEHQLEGVLAAVERSVKEGSRLIAGGRRMDDDSYLMEPTLFEDVGDDALLSCQEVFGPVTSLYRFSTFDEAIRRANAVPHGLCAAIFTSSLEFTRRFAAEIQAGIVKVNAQTAGADVHVPFGGVKASGFGPHEQGRAALEFYTEIVTVYEHVPT